MDGCRRTIVGLTTQNLLKSGDCVFCVVILTWLGTVACWSRILEFMLASCLCHSDIDLFLDIAVTFCQINGGCGDSICSTGFELCRDACWLSIVVSLLNPFIYFKQCACWRRAGIIMCLS